MPFYVYLLKCRDDSLYCGYTSRLEKRVSEHNRGKASRYTRTRRPVKLVYWEQWPSKSRAMKREAEVKRLSRDRKKKLTGLDS